MSFGNYPTVLTLPEMVKALDREWGTWAEPADALKLFPDALGFLTGKLDRLCKFTKPE